MDPQPSTTLGKPCKDLLVRIFGCLKKRAGRVWRLLGGSWVVISRVISPSKWVIVAPTRLIPPFITTHEPPSRVSSRRSFLPARQSDGCSGTGRIAEPGAVAFEFSLGGPSIPSSLRHGLEGSGVRN